jgi:hypothetical protein
VESGVDKKLTAFGFLDVEFGWPGDGGLQRRIEGRLKR